MTSKPKDNRKRSCLYLPLMLLIGFALIISVLLVLFPPDRRVATIVPGSSSKPAFVVQVVRPRMGLPFGGILPPQLFGHEAHLGFDSTSEGAAIRNIGPGRIELGANEWDLLLVHDGEGRVTSETQVVFDLLFEERQRRVRCRPDDPAVGTLNIVKLEDSGEFAGSFDIQLAHCEDAATGKPLGWPPQPLILHGSFDRLSLDADKK